MSTKVKYKIRIQMFGVHIHRSSPILLNTDSLMCAPE